MWYFLPSVSRGMSFRAGNALASVDGTTDGPILERTSWSSGHLGRCHACLWTTRLINELLPSAKDQPSMSMPEFKALQNNMDAHTDSGLVAVRVTLTDPNSHGKRRMGAFTCCEKSLTPSTKKGSSKRTTHLPCDHWTTTCWSQSRQPLLRFVGSHIFLKETT